MELYSKQGKSLSVEQYFAVHTICTLYFFELCVQEKKEKKGDHEIFKFDFLNVRRINAPWEYISH